MRISIEIGNQCEHERRLDQLIAKLENGLVLTNVEMKEAEAPALIEL